MATMRETIINRIDVHIDMTMDSINSLVADIEVTDTDDEIDLVAHDIKRVRALKALKIVLQDGNLPMRGSKIGHVLLDVLEEMMDLDV